jgi:hypothetical protein
MSLLDAADNGVNTPYIETVEITERSGKALLRTKWNSSTSRHQEKHSGKTDATPVIPIGWR